LNKAGMVIECPHCQNSLQLPASIPVARPIPLDSVQTRGRDSARTFKAIGALLMILSVPGCGIAAATNSDAFGALGFFGFFGGMMLFVVGRFQE
jgi:hypothetical protein